MSLQKSELRNIYCKKRRYFENNEETSYFGLICNINNKFIEISIKFYIISKTVNLINQLLKYNIGP